MSLLQDLDRLPPCLCRFLARTRNGKRGLTVRELAESSGLPRATVQDLSSLTSWAAVPMERADCFAMACGVDLARPRQTIAVLRRASKRGFWHVTHADTVQRRFYHRLLQLAKSTQSRAG